MDYKTNALSRKDIRKFSLIFRKIFKVDATSPFPVLHSLERLPDVFCNCNFEILDDNLFSKTTMARCIPNDLGGFTIQIKASIYRGAYEKHIGAYLGFICHEICHIFLFKIGYKPIYERSFSNGELSAYESVEWQAKALCGEVMMPYEATEKMTVSEIMQKYHVSKGFAKMRQNY